MVECDSVIAHLVMKFLFYQFFLFFVTQDVHFIFYSIGAPAGNGKEYKNQRRILYSTHTQYLYSTTATTAI
jgi:hypothetical protein